MVGSKKYPGGWSVGPEVYELDGISDKACVMSWHQDQIIEKPAAAEIAGSSAFCKYAALSYGDRALTIQPYPEFDAVYVADLVVARRTMLPDNLAVKTLTGLDKAPIYIITPTPFSLMGLDQWVGGLEFINYFDIFDELHPRILCRVD